MSIEITLITGADSSRKLRQLTASEPARYTLESAENINSITLQRQQYTSGSKRLYVDCLTSEQQLIAILKLNPSAEKVWAATQNLQPADFKNLRINAVISLPGSSSNSLRPDYYGGDKNPHEPIKIIEHYNLNFSKGNAVKYILRAGKNEDELKDLIKAQTYIEFEINRLKKLLAI